MKQKKNRRAVRGMGHLYKKVGSKQFPADSPALGRYYFKYKVNGKYITESLRDSDGNPITDRQQAEAERKRILAPYAAEEKVAVLNAVKSLLSDAEEEHNSLVARKEEEENPPLKIEDAWTSYVKSNQRPDSGERTLDDYSGYWKRFVRWLNNVHPEYIYMKDVTIKTAEEYATELNGEGHSGNRYNKHIGFLKLIYRTLAKLARITENPFEKISRRKQVTHSRRELTIEELAIILGNATGDLALLLLIGAATGLRLGDCCTLLWNEVDLVKEIIRRIPNKTARQEKPTVVKIGIPSALHHALDSIPKGRRTGYVLPDMAKQYKHNPSVITNEIKAHVLDCGVDVHAIGTGMQIVREPDGTPRRDQAGKVILEPTGKQAAVDVGFHSLRHTWVSMHASAGTPGTVIQQSVGHTNPAMTEHYTHINEATVRNIARALPIFCGEDTQPHKEPLPAWARELVEKLNNKNLKTIKVELLKG